MTSKTSTLATLVVIVLIATLPQISNDIYTPSLPAIAHQLQTTLGQSQLTLAFFMLGVAITNLIYGPLSEGIGRRYTLISGLIIATIGTIVCITSPSIGLLQLGRFIQGCGLGACNALWRSVFRDNYSGKELARMSSYLLNFVILAMMLAPFVGGYMQQYLGWRATFILLACWIFAVLLVVFKCYKESNKHHGTDRLNLKFIGKSYLEILTNRSFMAFAAINFFSYGGLFSWLTSGSMIFIKGIGITPVAFGYLMLSSGLATALGGLLNAQLLKRISLNRLITIGLCLMILSGLLIIAGAIFFGVNIAVVLIPTFIFITGSTLIFMNGFALAFESVGHIAGYAGAIYACIQLLGATIFASILSHLNTPSPIPMAIMFCVSGLLAGSIYILHHKAAK
ncbi:MAG: multidrug effflux MFS transporter [Coxiellaceae bacterium]|nr:multidrug effflux MFS transporter [Coxiellaceae bacterium]